MRKLVVILCSLLLAVSCSKEENLWCNVSIEASLASGEKLTAITIDSSKDGNYFRNLNTLEEYKYPTLVNGKGILRVLKGVYVLSFDGIATLENGSVKRVRCSEHSMPLSAAVLTGDNETLVLNLVEL